MEALEASEENDPQFVRACEMALEGRSRRTISRELALSLADFERMVRSTATRKKLFALAKADGLRILADDLQDIVHSGEIASESQKKLHCANITWLLPRRLRNEYSEKIEIVKEEKISLGLLLEEARSRTEVVIGDCKSTDMEQVIGNVDPKDELIPITTESFKERGASSVAFEELTHESSEDRE